MISSKRLSVFLVLPLVACPVACSGRSADLHGEELPPAASSDAGADVAALATVDGGDAEISNTSDGQAGDAADASTATDAADAADAAGPSQLDPTFGDGGILTIPEGALTDAGAYLSVHSMAARADGRVVFAGTNFTSPMIAQVLADGSGLDPSFGNGGIVLLPGIFSNGPGVDDDAVVALQVDGRILVGHMCSPPVYRNGASDICVTRLGADGSLDTTFGDAITDGGSGGRTGTTHMTTGGTETDGIGGLAIDSAGRILFAGVTGSIAALVGRLERRTG